MFEQWLGNIDPSLLVNFTFSRSRKKKTREGAGIFLAKGNVANFACSLSHSAIG
ncbi:hypothetical protein AAULR_09620, partial [Lacticaseibacillus rhamnosus MTCC 5462]